MGLFNLFKKNETVKPTTENIKPVANNNPPKKEPPVKLKETVKGTGMQYHMDNIMKFADENPDYSLTKKEMIEDGIYDRVYQYDFPVKAFSFEEEPDNEYDANAIKILADGLLVGYVKKGSCSHIKNLIKSDNIARINGEISGGKYKVLYDDSDDIEPHYVLEKDEAPFSVHLDVVYKNPK